MMVMKPIRLHLFSLFSFFAAVAVAQAQVPEITSVNAATGDVGVAFNYVITTDNPALGYSAQNLPAGLTRAGDTISGTPTTVGVTNVTLQAFNASGSGSSFNLEITINPIAPVITSSLSVSGVVNQPFAYQITADNDPTTFDALGLSSITGLTIDTDTGLISGTPTVTGSFDVAIEATNSAGTDQQILTITIATAPVTPVITSSNSVTGQVGVNTFSYQITATNSPTSFGVAGLGAIGGLSFNPSTGLITGTPLTSGVFTLTVSASNAQGAGNLAVTVTINDASGNSPVPVIISSQAASGVQGSSFSYQIVATNLPTSYSVTGLDPITGLAIDANTGLISGTPTVAGEFLVILNATNAAGTSADTPLTISIDSGAPVIDSALTAMGEVGLPFSYFITATNSPTSYNAADLANIGGLSIDTATGEISGSPLNSGSFDVQISATNANGSDVRTLVINISPSGAPVITSSLLVVGQQGQPFSYSITATNNPTSFSAIGLGVVTGLSLNSSGVISGTPTKFGIFTVTVTASNSSGISAPVDVIFYINQSDGSDPVPVITSSPTSSGVNGSPFNYTITALGNPSLYEVIGLDAIPGLSLVNNTITGTPTVYGSFIVELLATNAAGTGSLPLLIDLTAGTSSQAPEVLFNSPLPDEFFTLGETISVQVEVTDPDGFISNVQVASAIGGGTMNRLGLSDTYVFNYTPTNAQRIANNGVFSFTVSAVDNAGVIGSNSVSVYMDAPATPIVSIVTPNANANFAAGSVIPITVTAEAGAIGAFITSVQVFNGFNSLGLAQPTGTANQYILHYTTTQSDIGILNLNATATSSTGFSTSTPNRNVNVLPPASPLVTILSPVGTSSAAVGTPIDISVVATVNSGTITQVSLYVNGVLTSVSASDTPTFSHTFTNSGVNTAYVEATSSLGSVGVSSSITIISTSETPLTTDEGFITQTYIDLFYRGPSQAEIDSGVASLAGGMSRGAYIAGLLDTVLDEASIIEMMSVYRTMIPNWLDYDEWVTQYNLYLFGGSTGILSVDYVTALWPTFMLNNPQLTYPIVPVDITVEDLYSSAEGVNEANFFNILFVNKYGSYPSVPIFSQNVLATLYYNDFFSANGEFMMSAFATQSNPASPVSVGPSNLPVSDVLTFPLALFSAGYGVELPIVTFERRVKINQLIAGLLRRAPTDQEVASTARQTSFKMANFINGLLNSPEYEARFTPSFTLAVSSDANGSVVVVPNQIDPNDPSVYRFVDGSIVSLTAVPNAGFVFAGWTGSDSSTTNPLIFTVSQDSTLNATFAAAGSASTAVSSIMSVNGAPLPDTDLWLDYDGDGYSNIEEFAFGTDATKKGSYPVFDININGDIFTVDYVVLKDGLTPDMQIILECSGTMRAGSWHEIDASEITTVGVPQTGVPVGYQRVRVTLDVGDTNCSFVRGRVVISE